MVRFIIIFFNYMYQSKIAIYIPIWLDLLLIKNRLSKFKKRYLHSNMVRFIIKLEQNKLKYIVRFTFQYG